MTEYKLSNLFELDLNEFFEVAEIDSKKFIEHSKLTPSNMNNPKNYICGVLSVIKDNNSVMNFFDDYSNSEKELLLDKINNNNFKELYEAIISTGVVVSNDIKSIVFYDLLLPELINHYGMKIQRGNGKDWIEETSYMFVRQIVNSNNVLADLYIVFDVKNVYTDSIDFFLEDTIEYEKEMIENVSIKPETFDYDVNLVAKQIIDTTDSL